LLTLPSVDAEKKIKTLKEEKTYQVAGSTHDERLRQRRSRQNTWTPLVS
jgi:hypothetical protein